MWVEGCGGNDILNVLICARARENQLNAVICLDSCCIAESEEMVLESPDAVNVELRLSSTSDAYINSHAH